MATLALSSFFTTGSINVGVDSTKLDVADASGISIGNRVIVEIDGESGAGARGTIGVGGAWPAKSYATESAMNADTGQPDGKFAYVVTTGDVWRSFGGVWLQGGTIDYYTAKVIPLSLVANVIGKSGNQLTLDTAATVSTTNAFVYVDTYPVANAHASDGDGTTLSCLDGRFATSRAWKFQAKNGWVIEGAGDTRTTLFFPKGIADIAMIWFSDFGSDSQVKNICVEANAGSEGYMIASEDANQTVARFHYGIYSQQCDNFVSSDTKSVDVFNGSKVSFGNNPFTYRHRAFLTEPFWSYEQWPISLNDVVGGALVDCSVSCPKLIPGIELFKCVDSQIRGYVGTNASLSINTSDNWLISSPNIQAQANSHDAAASFSINSPLMTLTNAVVGPDISRGGEVRGATLTAEYINSDNDVLEGIHGGGDVPNVRVIGGTYTGRDYAAPSTLFGAKAIGLEGNNATVQCFTCNGAIQSGTPTIIRSNIGINNGAISYCRAGSIYPTASGGGVTLTGNTDTSSPLHPICQTSPSQATKAFKGGGNVTMKKGRR